MVNSIGEMEAEAAEARAVYLIQHATGSLVVDHEFGNIENFNNTLTNKQ